MTWVAAEAAGNKIEGFEYGARVEYDLVDGTTVHGKIIVQGTDKIGDVHGVELDTDVHPCELHWMATGLVRPEGGTPAAPAAPRTPQLTPAQDRALDQLRGTLHGKVRKGSGIQLGTARVLHRLGLAYLDESAFENGDWLLVMVEPQRQTITDEELLELPVAEAALLAPLDEKRRYRALRHAHIAHEHFGKGELRVEHADTSVSRAAVLCNAIPLMLAWGASRPGTRGFVDLAGRQWKAARETPTNVWYFGKGFGEPLLVVEAPTAEQAEAIADKMIAADPVGYRELTTGYGRRRLNVQEWADAGRMELAAQAA